MNIWNQSSPGGLGPVLLLSFLDFLVLADFKVGTRNHFNPDGLNCCSSPFLGLPL